MGIDTQADDIYIWQEIYIYYDTSVKTFPSSEAGLIDGYFGYLLAFICCGEFTQTFDLSKINLSDCRSSRNVSSHRH